MPEGSQPQGPCKAQSCAPNFLAAHLPGDFLGTSKELVAAKQAVDNHPIVGNNETNKLEREEWISLGFSEAALTCSMPSWPIPIGVLSDLINQ